MRGNELRGGRGTWIPRGRATSRPAGERGRGRGTFPRDPNFNLEENWHHSRNLSQIPTSNERNGFQDHQQNHHSGVDENHQQPADNTSFATGIPLQRPNQQQRPSMVWRSRRRLDRNSETRHPPINEVERINNNHNAEVETPAPKRIPSNGNSNDSSRDRSYPRNSMLPWRHETASNDVHYNQRANGTSSPHPPNEDLIGSKIAEKRPQQEPMLQQCRASYENSTNNDNNSVGDRASKGHVEQKESEIREKMQVHMERLDLPRLVEEIEQKLHKDEVDCMICYERVERSAAIWSCDNCYSIFHLHCIRKWAAASIASWRCPGCRSVQYPKPMGIEYYCFCGKVRDPSTDFYLTPHSCGDPCEKSRLKSKDTPGCPHNCTLQCHPGPCPPCTAMAPPRPCFCRKKIISRRCLDLKSGASCEQVCEKPLACGRHRCDKICHVGPCESCNILTDASCFCGQEKKTLPCGDMEVRGEVEWKKGAYSCQRPCWKRLSCENHDCNKRCHPGECGDCELLPRNVKKCPCGKTSLVLHHRKSCMDPVPTCSLSCAKLLPCGKHTCTNTCHHGPCPPCLVSVDQKCHCGTSSRIVPCSENPQGKNFFSCQRICGQKKSCGRHRCNEKCCSSRGRSGDWNPHLCIVPCGKKLRCGQHMCLELCHSGYCPPCPETIFTDLACACGKTSLAPPQPCGTSIPVCSFPCSIPRPCGHPPNHACHPGDCPPCTVQVDKACVGEHIILKNVPCGSRDIRCSNLCGRTRECGMHPCKRTCHLPPCSLFSSLQGRSSCGQTCSAPRRDCRHTCSAPCHPFAPCPDLRCTFTVQITCSCGRLTAEVPCDAGGTVPDLVSEASVFYKLPAPLEPINPYSSRVPLGKRKLLCDKECGGWKKKMQATADAFDIQTSTFNPPGTNGDPSQLLADMTRRDPQWVSAVQERFKYLVMARAKAKTLHVHVFGAMAKEKREAVKLLGQRWKLSVWEHRRFFVVEATHKSVVPPLKGALQATGAQGQPVFDSSLDVDPRLVICLMDLPREATVSSLALRFGGECELVWLNDRNALAIFGDPRKAAIALRSFNGASAYRGAAAFASQSGAVRGKQVNGLESVGENCKTWPKMVAQFAEKGDSSGFYSSKASDIEWQQTSNPISSTEGSITRAASLSSQPLATGVSDQVSLRSQDQNEQDSMDVVDDWEKLFTG